MRPLKSLPREFGGCVGPVGAKLTTPQKTSKLYLKAWSAWIFHAAAEKSARVVGEEMHKARKVPKGLVGKVECVFTGHDEKHDEAGRLLNDCPVNFEWRYHCKAPAVAYDIRGVCTTRLLASSVAYFPDMPIRAPLGILNACSVAYVLQNLPLKKPRCAVFGVTLDRGKKIEIVALGLPKDLRSLPARGTVVRNKDDKRRAPTESVWKLACIDGERWIVISAGRARKNPHTYMYDSRRMREHEFNKTGGATAAANKRRKLVAATSSCADDFPRPRGLEDVNSPSGKHTGGLPFACCLYKSYAIATLSSPGLRDCFALAHVLAEAKRAELNDSHSFDSKKALGCLETDPFAWPRREKQQLVLVLVWRCEKQVYGRFVCMKDMIAQLAQ